MQQLQQKAFQQWVYSLSTRENATAATEGIPAMGLLVVNT
jgi:hypothetical protein